jgi:KipI family sensor histidine kinase inhibitor
MEIQLIGDACVSLVFGEEISVENSRSVLAAYRQLKGGALLGELGIHDLVPSYRALAAHFEPGADPWAVARALAEQLAPETRPCRQLAANPGKTVEIPVVYDGKDLSRVAEIHGLSVADVIRLHCGATYQVAMVGFKPFFPYLIGLDPRLETPRLASPRKRVAAGSVAIGGAQTGIYPEDSPGGWNIVGRMDPQQLQAILPGDTVIFHQSEES